MQNYFLTFKTVSILLFSLVAFFVVLQSPVSAHILQSDGKVGAVLHIDPEDDPVAGEQSAFFWEFKDTSLFENCVCRVKIFQNGDLIKEEPVFNPTYTFTFPKKDIYEVHLIGTPKIENAFNNFDLSYDIRVEREAGNAPQKSIQNGGIFFMITFGILSGLVIVGVVRSIYNKRT